MLSNLKYMPTFRSRQQELIVLTSFIFGDHMFPMIEIIKEHDRKRKEENQLTFHEIYNSTIDHISATKVFVDLPLYLKERASMKDEVLIFSRSVISNMEIRTEYLNSLASQSSKIIPVISSYKQRSGLADSLYQQVKDLRTNFESIAFRSLYNHFLDDWDEIQSLATQKDFIILDLDSITPYPNPGNRRLINSWREFNTCPKILLRSAIDSDITNVGLEHDDIVFSVDNGLIETYRKSFHADAFGDYVGIKKDDLTTGGRISPGFLFYDAVNNQFMGFKGDVKRLEEFESTIVPAVLGSTAAHEMEQSGLPYLLNNTGWNILNNISTGAESGKSQAKFKRIAMEHYLHCMKTKIEAGEFD